MKKLSSLFACLLLAIVSFDAVAQAADVAAINDLLDRIENVFAAGDIDGAMTAFTEDAVILPDDSPDITGAEAIRAAYTGLMAQFEVEVSFMTTGIDVAGDMAFEQGTYVFKLTDKAGIQPVAETRYRHIHILKRQSDGGWRTWRMMTNGLGPATAP